MAEEVEDKKEEEKPQEEKQTLGMVDSAVAAAEKLKAENDRFEKLLERQERVAARQALGGTSEAGQKPEPPKKDTDEEYAAKLERGEVNPLQEDGFVK